MIVQLYGEWAEASPVAMTYEAAVAAGCQAFADRRKEYFLSRGRNREQSMVSKGLALYIDIPAALEGEIRPNGATLNDVPRACRDGGPTRVWTDGLVTVPEAVAREALEAFWLLNNPDYGLVPAEWREGMRRAKPASVEDLSGLIDYSRCRQAGPVLVVESDDWRFEEPADQCQEMPFLVALSDPHHYRLPLTGPYGSWGRAREQERSASNAAHTPPRRMGWRW